MRNKGTEATSTAATFAEDGNNGSRGMADIENSTEGAHRGPVVLSLAIISHHGGGRRSDKGLTQTKEAPGDHQGANPVIRYKSCSLH